MNRKEFINFVSERSGIPRYKLEESIDALTDGIKGALRIGRSVKLVGFGSFDIKKSSARTGRNIASGETVIIPPQYKPIFKPGTELVEAVRQYEQEQEEVNECCQESQTS